MIKLSVRRGASLKVALNWFTYKNYTNKTQEVNNKNYTIKLKRENTNELNININIILIIPTKTTPKTTN